MFSTTFDSKQEVAGQPEVGELEQD